jgi:hypothetical protein
LKFFMFIYEPQFIADSVVLQIRLSPDWAVGQNFPALRRRVRSGAGGLPELRGWAFLFEEGGVGLMAGQAGTIPDFSGFIELFL